MSTEPKKGVTFTHLSFRDPDAPHDRAARATMKVTAVRKGNVYYTYTTSKGNKGAFYLPVEEWAEKYGG